MAARSEKASALADSARGLPKNRESLSVLLRAVEKLLEFLEPNHHGQRMRLHELERTLKEPLNIVTNRPFLQAVARAHHDRFAQGGPSISAIVPYVDTLELRRLSEKERAASEKMKMLAEAKPPTVADWRPCIEAFAEMVAADAEIIGLFRELQRNIILALDGVEQPGEKIQLTVPEIAAYIFGSTMRKTSRASNERLVRKWIQNGKMTARKVGRGLYSIAVSHLEILKEANR